MSTTQKPRVIDYFAGWENHNRLLVKMVAPLTEDDLDAKFQRPKPNAAGERPWRDRRFIVWHVAEHDIHHGGEISIILGMHGRPGLDM